MGKGPPARPHTLLAGVGDRMHLSAAPAVSNHVEIQGACHIREGSKSIVLGFANKKPKTR